MADKAVNYLSVRIGSQWYGIKVGQVIEVLRLVAFTEFPGLGDDILGLITVRNEVMPLVDLRRRFGIKDAPLDLDTPIVAIRAEAGPIALLVDDADRVEEIQGHQMLTSRETRQLPLIRAVAKLPGHLLFLLNTNLISSLEFSQMNQQKSTE